MELIIKDGEKMNEQNNRNTELKIAVAASIILALLLIAQTSRLIGSQLAFEFAIKDNNELVKQYNEVTAPKLKTALSIGNEEFVFSITGIVMNIGGDGNPLSSAGDAYYCRLHVMLYKDDIVVKDTYIKIGDYIGHIAPEKYDRVDVKIYHDVSKITDWKITPEIGTWEES